MPDEQTGIPFTVGELRLASRQRGDVYHLALMAWAADEIDRLAAIRTEQPGAVPAYNHTRGDSAPTPCHERMDASQPITKAHE